MSDPLQALLQASTLEQTLFPATSRYHGIATGTLQRPDGTTVIFLKRRMIPAPEGFAGLHEHVVVDGERLDNITAHYLSDPLQFWQICDANRAMRPNELTEVPGRRLRITLPNGIPGVPGA
ncbi:MAG: LysM domain-containing protein [Pseudomonadota bacterium]